MILGRFCLWYAIALILEPRQFGNRISGYTFAFDSFRNSLSNSPCPLGSAGGRSRYILLARAINNKPFQCSNGRDSPQRRRTAARVAQGDLFKFYARSRSLISAHLWSSLATPLSLTPPARLFKLPGPIRLLRHVANKAPTSLGHPMIIMMTTCPSARCKCFDEG